MEIFKWLDNQKYIESYHIQEFRQTETVLYWKIKIIFVDESVLFIKEYVSEEVRKYAFHWQQSKGKMIIRWDNAPHHQHISTYPHHKHIEEDENVVESKNIFLEDVLTYIFSNIENL